MPLTLVPDPPRRTGMSLGCVLAADRGVYDLWCAHGRVRVSLGGRMLARMACDPAEAPAPGDWCLVRSWPDGPRTLERVLTGACR